MSAPTQAFPPWLSPSPFTVTQDGTVVVETTVIQLPQTYYGPSIPLDSAWVFGGSTFPASIATSFASPTSTLSATPSQTSTSVSSSSTSLSTSTSSTSTSPSSSSSPKTSSNGISSSTRLAIILSTVFGASLLILLAIILWRIRRRRREFSHVAQEFRFSNWQLVSPEAAHQPLEGPAEEGEGSAFLADEPEMQELHVESTLTRELTNTSSQRQQIGTALSRGTSDRSGSAPGPAKSDSSSLGSASQREALSRFNASASSVAAGSLFFNPARVNDQRNSVRRSEDERDQETKTSLTAANLGSSSYNYAARPPGAGPPHLPTRLPDLPLVDPQYNLPLSPEDDEAEEPLRPPRTLDPDRSFRSQNNPPSRGSTGSWVYPDSPPSETDERATLLTAQRVNVGSVAHPVLASPPSEKKSLEDFTTNLEAVDVDSVGYAADTPPSPRSWVGMRGFSGIARGLGRLSWFRRMEEAAGTSGTRHSSPNLSNPGSGSRPGSKPGSGPGTRPGTGQGSRPGTRPGTGQGSRPGTGQRSRPTSGVSFMGLTSGNRRFSGLLHPPFSPRPRSEVSFRGIEPELGMRPPGIRISGTGSGSAGSGSGKSGGTVYHSVSSRPQTPMYISDVPEHHGGEFLAQPTPITFPPELDLGEGDRTIRSVDVLDLPAPEGTLPFTSPLRLEPAVRSDSASSRGTGLAFPPGLVSVPQWDRGSHSSASNRREERDLLEEAPPRAGGEWSSLRSQRSSNNVGNGGNGNRLTERRGGPVTRHNTGEQSVQVIAGDHAASETASFSSGLPQGHPLSSGLQHSPVVPSLNLTPSVSIYASSHSRSGSGSHSSRPSQLTTAHSHELSHHSSFQESEEGHLLAGGPGFHRASLSAMGGQGGPPSPPHARVLNPMQLQTTIEAEDESGSTSRPNTGTSRPTLSEAAYAGTFASGSTSTGAPTTVPSMTDSTNKR